MRNCILYVTDANPRYVKFTENAIRYAKAFLGDTECVVMTNRRGLKVKGADKVWYIGDYLERWSVSTDSTRFSNIVFMKLIAPLTRELDRYDGVVCYDPDTIVTSGKVKELFSIKFDEGSYVACVPDAPSDVEPQLARLAKNGVKAFANGEYFGAGLMVYDMPRIRGNMKDYESLVGKSVGFHYLNKTRFPEQDPLNVFFKITKLDRRFDRIVGLGTWFDRWKDEYALHFPARKKEILDRICGSEKIMTA